MDLLYGLAGQVQVKGQAELLIGLYDIQEVVGCQSALLLRGLGGPDVHVAVHLAAVGVDYLSMKGLAQPKGQLTLASGGGAYDG